MLCSVGVIEQKTTSLGRILNLVGDEVVELVMLEGEVVRIE